MGFPYARAQPRTQSIATNTGRATVRLIPFMKRLKLLVNAKAAKSAEETSVWNDFMRPIL